MSSEGIKLQDCAKCHTHPEAGVGWLTGSGGGAAPAAAAGPLQGRDRPDMAGRTPVDTTLRREGRCSNDMHRRQLRTGVFGQYNAVFFQHECEIASEVVGAKLRMYVQKSRAAQRSHTWPR